MNRNESVPAIFATRTRRHGAERVDSELEKHDFYDLKSGTIDGSDMALTP